MAFGSGCGVRVRCRAACTSDAAYAADRRLVCFGSSSNFGPSRHQQDRAAYLSTIAPIFPASAPISRQFGSGHMTLRRSTLRRSFTALHGVKPFWAATRKSCKERTRYTERLGRTPPTPGPCRALSWASSRKIPQRRPHLEYTNDTRCFNSRSCV